MSTVISRDGTGIAYEKAGQGAAVILIDGAMGYRAYHGGRELAAQLSKDFTVYAYDRRGRGESGDTKPYTVEREIEDIEALIDMAGGSAYLYGMTSGATLALRAAMKLGAEKVLKLAVYEPPFSIDDDSVQGFNAYKKELDDLIDADKNNEAVARMLSDMMPPEMLEQMKRSPEWELMVAVAPTLSYDNAVMGDNRIPPDVASANMPMLILDGDSSIDFMRAIAEELAKAMPHAERRTLKAEEHDVSTESLAPALTEFFNA